MAGHSKWHNIKHRKAAQDSKKSKIYAKVAKQIEIAAKQGADPDMNPSLAAVLSKAKSVWVPKDVIERAIKKGSWQIEWEKLEEVFYEGYWPWWVALYIKCITSNTNRSSASIKAILAKHWWNMWEVWSVAWQFDKKWVVYVSWKVVVEKEKWKDVEKTVDLDQDLFEEQLLELDIEDYQFLDDWVRIITDYTNLVEIKKQLENLWYKVESAEIEFIPQNYIQLSQEQEQKLINLIDILEDNEDVDTVFHNAQ